MSYAGWKNWETWSVAQWVHHDYFVREKAIELCARSSNRQLPGNLKRWVHRQIPIRQSVFSDLFDYLVDDDTDLGTRLRCVDWQELARSLINSNADRRN